jgi:hypothetical protein
MHREMFTDPAPAPYSGAAAISTQSTGSLGH